MKKRGSGLRLREIVSGKVVWTSDNGISVSPDPVIPPVDPEPEPDDWEIIPVEDRYGYLRFDDYLVLQNNWGAGPDAANVWHSPWFEQYLRARSGQNWEVFFKSTNVPHPSYVGWVGNAPATVRGWSNHTGAMGELSSPGTNDWTTQAGFGIKIPELTKAELIWDLEGPTGEIDHWLGLIDVYFHLTPTPPATEFPPVVDLMINQCLYDQALAGQTGNLSTYYSFIAANNRASKVTIGGLTYMIYVDAADEGGFHQPIPEGHTIHLFLLPTNFLNETGRLFGRMEATKHDLKAIVDYLRQTNPLDDNGLPIRWAQTGLPITTQLLDNDLYLTAVVYCVEGGVQNGTDAKITFNDARVALQSEASFSNPDYTGYPDYSGPYDDMFMDPVTGDFTFPGDNHLDMGKFDFQGNVVAITWNGGAPAGQAFTAPVNQFGSLTLAPPPYVSPQSISLSGVNVYRQGGPGMEDITVTKTAAVGSSPAYFNINIPTPKGEAVSLFLDMPLPAIEDVNLGGSVYAWGNWWQVFGRVRRVSNGDVVATDVPVPHEGLTFLGKASSDLVADEVYHFGVEIQAGYSGSMVITLPTQNTSNDGLDLYRTTDPGEVASSAFTPKAQYRNALAFLMTFELLAMVKLTGGLAETPYFYLPSAQGSVTGITGSTLADWAAYIDAGVPNTLDEGDIVSLGYATNGEDTVWIVLVDSEGGLRGYTFTDAEPVSSPYASVYFQNMTKASRVTFLGADVPIASAEDLHTALAEYDYIAVPLPPVAAVLSSPTGVATGETTATAGVTIDTGNGTLYVVASTSTTQPSNEQIIAGQTHTGAAAPWASSLAVSSSGAKTLPVTGLTTGTTYYLHFVHVNASSQNSNRVVSAAFVPTSEPADEWLKEINFMSTSIPGFDGGTITTGTVEDGLAVDSGGSIPVMTGANFSSWFPTPPVATFTLYHEFEFTADTASKTRLLCQMDENNAFSPLVGFWGWAGDLRLTIANPYTRMNVDIGNGIGVHKVAITFGPSGGFFAIDGVVHQTFGAGNTQNVTALRFGSDSSDPMPRNLRSFKFGLFALTEAEIEALTTI